jgi:hypothetical protein
VPDDRTPNWNKWRLIPNPTLWQCVALSLNIDPDKVHKEWLEINLVIREEGRKFNDRLAIALANAGDTGALRPTKYTMDSKCWEVSLRQFAAWAHRVGWEAPPELLAMADLGGGRLAEGPEWPWGSHETKLLRYLAAAAKKFWENYDPGDPTTAPTNQQVIDWLKTQGVAERNAEVMATILRADGLPTGPRT